MAKTQDPGRTRPRRLLLCLDGVPHELILAARNRGLFAKFNSPTRLLSPFPTMTNVALSAMFNASPPAGYESLYFDKASRRFGGGISKYLGRRTPDKIPSSYMDQLDYQEPLPFEFLIYVAPERVWRTDMQRFRERFRDAPQERDYFAFLKATDGLLHAQGPARLAVALEALDKILLEVHAFCGRETEIVLFSDHGMNLEDNRRVNLATELRRHGFNLRANLDNGGKSDLAIPAFGLCSYVAIYCRDEETIPKVSNALVDVAGIDFSAFRSETGVFINSALGSAIVERRIKDDATYFRYVRIEGDPLKLDSILNSLGAQSKLDPEGFGSDSVWFEATKQHDYPDALANIYHSIYSQRVKHTADILLSLKDGHYYGWSPFGHVVRLRATHGNALRQSSNAFLMSTHRELSECVRADDAQAILRG